MRFLRFRFRNGPNWWSEFSIVSGKRRIKKGWRGGPLRRNRALMQLSVGNLKQYQEKKYWHALDKGIHEPQDSPLWNELVYTHYDDSRYHISSAFSRSRRSAACERNACLA